MWNNRRSFILLIRIKRGRKLGLFIPVVLPVIEATLESWYETLKVWEALFYRLLAKPERSQHIGRKPSLSTLIAWSITLLKELRRHGRYELVCVENDKDHVSLQLW